jgi:bifunctional pyridoxal-dependent enzyme with beta-cystathionase and maltose regulon repressor activities
MADPNANLRELMEALEAERLKSEVLRERIMTYKQVVKNLSGVIVALTSNIDVAVTDNPTIVAAALTTWRETITLLNEMDERDKAAGWDELTS